MSVVDDAGIFAGKGRLWYVYTDPTSGSQYVFDTSEVMHFKTSFSFDGVTGLPVQQILRDTISGASASQRYMNSLYESGLTAKATLEYTGELNDKAKEALVKSFEDFGSGARNTGKIIPVPLGMKLTPLDIKLSDSQFFELKKYTALQIAAAFGVKPNQINDYSKSSYANSELQQLSFYVDTELFVIKQYEEEINYKMLTDEEQDDGFYYKYNEKVLFRTDSKTQMEYLKNGVSGSIMKPNEARRKLDLPDGEGGDTLLANGSIVPLFCFCVIVSCIVLHLLVTRLLKVKFEYVLLSAVACISDGPTAALIASSAQWKTMITTGLLMGVLAGAMGNYLGIAVAYAIRGIIGV